MSGNIPEPLSGSTGTQVAELPRYSVTEYRPDGGFNVGGMLMLISALVLVGGVLGLATHYISKVFYLIILFPVLIGIALGAVGKKMIVNGRVRNPIIGGIAGFLGGIFAMTMTHWFDYEEFKTTLAKMQPEMRDAARELAHMNPAERESQLGEAMSAEDRSALNRIIELVSVENFLDYMNLEAREGVVIKHGHSSTDRGINLGFYGSHIYWIVEILIVAGITFASVRGAAAEPFCAQCGDWKKFKLRGFFEISDIGAVASALRSGDLNQVRAVKPTDRVTNQRLTSMVCPHCGSSGETDVKLESLSTDGKGNVIAKTAAFVRYPGEAQSELESLFAPAPPANSQAAQEGDPEKAQ